MRKFNPGFPKEPIKDIPFNKGGIFELFMIKERLILNEWQKEELILK